MCTVKTEYNNTFVRTPNLAAPKSFQRNDEQEIISQAAPWKYTIQYDVVLLMIYLHISAVYGMYLAVTCAKWQTIIYTFGMYIIGGLGVTAGAHRLWSHRAYKVKLPLEIALMLLNCIAFQYSVINWVKDHRLHHKYSDTDADPHNPRRGLFFSHIGWLLVEQHDLVKEREKCIDLSDVENNPVLKFQKKYAFPLAIAAAIVIPSLIPVLFWKETVINAWHLNWLRYVITLNSALLVNSAAHRYGNKPYDKTIMPTENFLASIMTGGEGFHNYHHAFPWDYRTAEFGKMYFNNATTWFINTFARFGWAYDLKTASPEIINRKARNAGDNSRFLHASYNNN